ncbi:MAG: circularly permuted type 2 ATP-grasp protein [Chloroflexi bacterium]|nr:MAG: circularly permuted type 2 ATP-grasp protein [Chloroflexota bacterium]
MTTSWLLQRSLNARLTAGNGAATALAGLLDAGCRQRVMQSNPDVRVRLLPAPVLLDRDVHQRLAADTVSLTGLLVELPRLLYGGAVDRMCADLGLGPLMTAAIRTTAAPPPVVFARWDLFETEAGWQLVEVNVGGGMGGGHVGDWNRLMLGAPVLGEFLRAHGLAFDDPLDTCAEVLRQACLEAGLPDPPLVAVVDWTVYYDQCILFLHRTAAALERAGCRTVVCHVGELRRRRGRLCVGDRAVDAVVANYLLTDLCSAPMDLDDVLACQADGSVLSAMTFFGDLIGAKGAMALLWRAVESGVLSPADADLVRRYVPETRLVGGRGVVIGARTDERAWLDAVRAAVAAPGTYVAQRLVRPAALPLPALSDGGEAILRDRALLLSAFVANGRHGGYWVTGGAAGEPAIVNLAHGAEHGAAFHG